MDPFYGSTQSSKARSGLLADQHWERSKEQLKALAAGPDSALDRRTDERSWIGQEDNTADADATDQIGMGEDERQGRDTLTYVKPSMDVYKAIFESDEEEDADEIKPARIAAVPKMQDPASGSGVVFQARAKNRAQDAHDKGDPPAHQAQRVKGAKEVACSPLTSMTETPKEAISKDRTTRTQRSHTRCRLVLTSSGQLEMIRCELRMRRRAGLCSQLGKLSYASRDWSTLLRASERPRA